MRWVAPLLVLALTASACSAPPGRDGPDAAGPSDGRPAVDADVDADGPGFFIQYADPDHGPFRGNTLTTIRGQGFLPNDEVWIGDRLVLGQRYIDSRRFEVLTPPGDPGDATIEIRRFIGPPTSRAMAFAYDAIAVDPPSGSVAGGTFVTITGFGTDFVDGATVLFDGLPATGVTVENGQRLTGYAPPGIAGDADVLVRTPTDAYAARRAYTYFTTGDPFAGGLSGGPLAGTLNVVVLDQYTKDGIPGAFVAVGDPGTTAYRGTTDALGQITFSGPELIGPQTVTAWAADHEVGSFHCFDAANLTIWLRTPIPPPDGGPPPIGVEGSRIHGHVMFGDGVGLGSPFWNLVPEPRTPTEKKRIYVTSAASSLTGGPTPPLAAIDYSFDPARLAWPYEVAARPGALAVVAVAGLYDPARDPDDNGSDGFEPFAVGLARGVLVGPGEDKTGVDIVVNIPLDSALRVQLDDPPALDTPGWRGPTRYQFRGGADLGGEGLVHFGKHGLRLVPGGLLAGEVAFAPGTTSLTVARIPALAQALADGSYAMSVGAYSDGGGPPYSVRVVRGVTSTAAPVVIGDFLPVPRALDPAPAGVATARHLVLGAEAPAAAVPTFRLHMLSDEVGNPVWRAVTCGAMTEVPMPDLSSIGVTYPPPGQIITWVTWAITTPAPFGTFSYRWFGSAYWQAYASDAWTVQFPAP